MTQGHLYIDLLVKVYVYECVYHIILDHLKVKTSGDGHKGVEAIAGEYGGVYIYF